MVLNNLISHIIEKQFEKMRTRPWKYTLDSAQKRIKRLNPKLIKLYQQNRLCNCIKYSVENSPYYKEHIANMVEGINFRKVYSYFDKLPLTSAHDISEHQESFLAVPKEKIAAYHFTAGSSGRMKTIYLTQTDLQEINYRYFMGFVNSGYDQTDIAQIMYSFGIWQFAELLAEALRRIGIVTIPTGNYMSFEEQQHFIEKYNVSILAGTPSYIYTLAQEIDLPQKNKERMKGIILGAEALPEHRRKVIEERLGGEAFIGYGMMEFGGGMANECSKHCGYHIYPSFLFEIIDPKTGEKLEKEEYGEIVITSLLRQGMPLIRYRTADISRLLDLECDCGLKLPMLDYIKGRADDRVFIGTAEKYYPEDFDRIFDPIKEVKDYWVEVTNDNGKDIITAFILTSKPSDKLKKEVLDAIYSLTPIKVDVFNTKTVNEPIINFVNKIEPSVKRRRLIDKRKDKHMYMQLDNLRGGR